MASRNAASERVRSAVTGAAPGPPAAILTGPVDDIVPGMGVPVISRELLSAGSGRLGPVPGLDINCPITAATVPLGRGPEQAMDAL